MQEKSFSSLYLEGSLDSFFEKKPWDVDTLTSNTNIKRDELVSALRDYANKLNAPLEVHTSLDKLSNKSCLAIVTGQQVGLLLGPLYTLTKAINAIKLAQELSTSEQPVVPIFWLASQDADINEINQAYFLDFDESLYKLDLPLPNNIPAGRISLKDSWLNLIVSELRKLSYDSDNFKSIKDLLETTFKESSNIADWFAAILYKVLGQYGLIILNPLEKDIAKLTIDAIKFEVDHPLKSTKSIISTSNKLIKIGLKPQLGRASDTTNLFIEENEKRVVLRYQDGFYKTDTTCYTIEQLYSIIDTDPTLITPAAGLRPIIQDVILPTAIFVVGPGELKYISQLREVYTLHGIKMPLIWPRMSVNLLEHPVQRILKKYNLDVSDLQANFDKSVAEALFITSGHDDFFNEKLEDIEKTTKSIEDYIINEFNDQEGPLKSVQFHKGKINYSINRLRRRLRRFEQIESDTYTKHTSRLKLHLIPDIELVDLNNKKQKKSILQERLYSPFSFFLKYGINVTINKIFEAESRGDNNIEI